MPDVQPLDPTDPLRLGAYRVTGRLGSGGQGVVYLGESEDGAAVAIKLFHARLDADDTWRDAFTRELDAAKRVARFCVAQVLDSGMSGGRPYIVSEYVPGRSLHEVVHSEGPRSGSALDRLAISTATALVALHDAGVVHRDFKPNNVLLAPDGPRVIDFGIARALAGAHTVTSQVVGTPAYMSPEQFAGGELGLAVDVFSWAATMAFAATGRPPFGTDSLPAIMNRVLNAPPDLDGVEPPLRDLLAECLHKDPVRRPSAHQVLDRLVRRNEHAAVASAGPEEGGRGAVVGGHPTDGIDTAASGGGVSPTTGPPPGRGRRGMLVAAAVVLAVAAGAAIVVPNAQAFGLLGGGSTGTGTPSATPIVTPSGGAQHVAKPSGTPSASAVPERTPVPARTAKPTPTRTAAKPPSRPSGGATRRPTATPTSRPSSSHTAKPTKKPTTKPTSKPTKSSTPPVTSSPRLTELGPGHFTDYCKTLGWEWVEYRTTPQPGAYCVRRSGATLLLNQAQRDAGCRWRYDEPKAVHRFKGKTNYCYVYR